MRNLIATGVTLAGIGAAVAVPAGAASTTQLRSFKETVVGASVSSGEYVYDIHGTNGHGAGIQKLKVNSKGTAGTDTLVSYDGFGTIVSHDSFTLSAPNTAGIITVKGSGHFVSGTGRYAKVQGSYTIKGTLNTKTTVVKASITGKESF